MLLLEQLSAQEDIITRVREENTKKTRTARLGFGGYLILSSTNFLF